ncbi:MAG: dinitrogenase iron-molybdenum cofactor biosynthesis protein [Chloroflexota bacterium]|nr:MAG: dinitrogenase iron-molybdenum cofactor biosynthesis protein [Chloroflexota bacterium]
MLIAISLETNNGLDSTVAQHFGRCPYFGFVTTEDKKVQSIEVIDNPYYAGHQVGQVPGYINKQKADAMISGGMGGRAIQFFQEFGLGAYTGASGTVSQTMEKYFAGELNEAAPCNESIEHGHGDHDHDHHH